jgi:large subunit ribosomal protein L7e
MRFRAAAAKLAKKIAPKKKGAAVVPENFTKKVARDAKLLAAVVAARKQKKTDQSAKRAVALANAKKYDAEYTAADAALVKAKRDAKKAGSFFVEPEAKIAFVIRIRGINKLSPKQKKIMQLLRLRQLHNGTFVKLNRATWNMIRAVDPLVTYGFPTRSTVQKLIYGRGFGKVNRSRIPLNDNSVIDGVLGGDGIACVEDLIHEIWTVGDKFKKANNFLWPFKLSSPLKGFEKKRHPYMKGGAWGNREENINELIARMM